MTDAAAAKKELTDKLKARHALEKRKAAAASLWHNSTHKSTQLCTLETERKMHGRVFTVWCKQTGNDTDGMGIGFLHNGRYLDETNWLMRHYPEGGAIFLYVDASDPELPDFQLDTFARDSAPALFWNSESLLTVREPRYTKGCSPYMTRRAMDVLFKVLRFNGLRTSSLECMNISTVFACILTETSAVIGHSLRRLVLPVDTLTWLSPEQQAALKNVHIGVACSCSTMNYYVDHPGVKPVGLDEFLEHCHADFPGVKTLDLADHTFLHGATCGIEYQKWISNVREVRNLPIYDNQLRKEEETDTLVRVLGCMPQLTSLHIVDRLDSISGEGSCMDVLTDALEKSDRWLPVLVVSDRTDAMSCSPLQVAANNLSQLCARVLHLKLDFNFERMMHAVGASDRVLMAHFLGTRVCKISHSLGRHLGDVEAGYYVAGPSRDAHNVAVNNNYIRGSVACMAVNLASDRANPTSRIKDSITELLYGAGGIASFDDEMVCLRGFDDIRKTIYYKALVAETPRPTEEKTETTPSRKRKTVSSSSSSSADDVDS